ncbi:MAG: hypothetical protein ABDH28_06385 [Brevinematia bacterium]
MADLVQQDLPKMINRIITKIRTDRFYLDSLILTLFTILGNLFAFLVNIIYTWTLPPGQYGAVMSINSLINILGTVAIAFRMFNVRETTELASKGLYSKAINVSYKFALYSFAFLMITFILLTPLYSHLISFMNVDYFPLLIALIIIALTYLINITSSLFQSLKMFLFLGIVSFSYPFIRFVLTYPYIKVWNGYIGATASMLVGIIASFVLTSIILLLNRTNYNQSTSNNNDEKIELSYFVPLIPIVLINLSYSILNFGDVIFSRRYFNEIATDIFAIASTIAKANLFVIIPISYVVLPRMIEDLSTRGYRASVITLFKGLALAIASSLAYALFIFLFSDIILKIFGERYLEAKPILFLFTIAFIPIGVSFILINYSITFKNWYFIIPLLIADLALIGGFMIFHSTFEEMIMVDLVVGLLLFISLILLVTFSKKPKPLTPEEVTVSEKITQV